MNRIIFILFRYAVAFFILVLLWQFGSWGLGTDMIPSPFEVIKSWYQAIIQTNFSEHIVQSSKRICIALILAWVIAFPIGLFLGYRKRADQFLSPLVFITYPLPKIVLLPIFLTIFGLGDLPKILLIALTAGYQILVVTRDSIRHLDNRYIESFQTLGGTLPQLIQHVLIPAALPEALTSLKIASGTAVAVLFMAESFATRQGLGFYIMDAWGRGDQTEMFIGILSMSILGLILYETFHILEKIVSPWKNLKKIGCENF